MSKLQAAQALASKAAETIDQTLEQEYSNLFDEGKTYVRFVEYVETGKQVGEFNGKKKTITPCRVGFQVLGIITKKTPKGRIEEYVDDEGKTRDVAGILRPYDLTISSSAKSNFMKLFKKMRAGREEITHMAQMLGEAFKVDICTLKTTKGREYSSVRDADGEWHVDPPVLEKENEDGDFVTVNLDSRIPQIVNEEEAVKLFIWEFPTKEAWDDLYIEGEYERKVKDADGKETGEKEKVSKNFIQETIKSAKNFEGSPLQLLLLDTDGSADDIELSDDGMLNPDPEEEKTADGAVSDDELEGLFD